jgi:hypothetical protein
MLLWLYGESGSLLWYVAVIAGSAVFSVFTRSRTGIMILFMTLILAVIIRVFPKLKDAKIMYILEVLITPVMCVASAVLAAGYSEYGYTGQGIEIPFPRLFWAIDYGINNRISNLYCTVPEHGAILSKWQLFAGHNAEDYFDMGWVRLFYWYGIIPTALIAVAVALVIYVCYKKRDMWTMLIILSLSVYTIIEATFVSRYMGRAFYLLIAGVYLGYLIKGKIND